MKVVFDLQFLLQKLQSTLRYVSSLEAYPSDVICDSKLIDHFHRKIQLLYLLPLAVPGMGFRGRGMGVWGELFKNSFSIGHSPMRPMSISPMGYQN